MAGSLFSVGKFSSGLALSVTAYAVPPLPKGEALARPYTLHFSRKLYRHAKGSPLGRAGALAPERARKLSRSAALSQKAALQMPLAVTTPPVKMRLERSAERDKREI